ncbi:MAG: metallophosphoesterase family protein [Rhodospirillales bacterium]
MKIGIVSDIHSNEQGLRLALEGMGDVDELLCLGDAIFEYKFSNEVVGLLKERRAYVIQGNHEEGFLSEAGRRARERPGIDPDLLQWLADQPHRRTVEFGGRTILMVHSTPWEPRGGYVYPHSANLERFAEADADYVMYGHTHAQVVRRVGRVTIVNPGSAGDARDHNNGRLLSYGVLDTASGEVTVTDYADPRYATPPL